MFSVDSEVVSVLVRILLDAGEKQRKISLMELEQSG